MTIGSDEFNLKQMEFAENAVKELRQTLLAEGISPFFIIWGMYSVGIKDTYAHYLKRREDELHVCEMLQEFVDAAKSVHSQVNN